MNKCFVCQGNEFTALPIIPVSTYTDKTYGLIRCIKCSVIFTNPIPTNKELNNIYRKWYLFSFHKFIHSEKRYRARKLAHYIQGLEGIKTAIDIGSMYGFLIEELKKKNIDCAGIEINPEAVEYSRKRKLDVEKSSLEEFLKQNGKKYDLIILSHVLEHLLDPRQKLINLKKHLNANGKILIIVPNFNSFTRKLFGNFWGYWDIPAHISHYDKNSLQSLINLSGFKTIDSKIVGGSSLLFFSSLAKKLNIRRTNSEISSMRTGVTKFISAFVKYWYYFGNDEIILVAQKTGKMNEGLKKSFHPSQGGIYA